MQIDTGRGTAIKAIYSLSRRLSIVDKWSRLGRRLRGLEPGPLTRDRTQPSADVDLQILRCDLENFGQGLIALIEEKIESIAIGEIEHGVWVDPEE